MAGPGNQRCVIRSAKPRAPAIEPLERRTLFAAVPAGFVDESFAASLSNPTAMDFAPDGRLFVCQQGGALRVVKGGTLLPTPFVSLNVDSAGERGLLGVAFDPNFATNHFVYVYHTVPAPVGGAAHNRVTRYAADPANPDIALAGSGTPILDLDNLSSTATNHNGGAIHFGPDGKLYVAVGENANPANAQTLSNRLGKVLRINSDGSIPADNPYFGTATGANRAIWALGLRNPFTFAFEPGTGKMHINDVGQNTWEEVDVGQAGANYGWSIIEGFRTTETPPANYNDPLFAYAHPTTGSDRNQVGTAITGGAFYVPAAGAALDYPAEYDGDYFYADQGNGWIRRLDAGTANSTLFATGGSAITDLKVGPDGGLYYLERGSSSVRRVTYTGIAASAGAAYAFNGTVNNKVLSVTAGTVTLTRDLAGGYPDVSLNVSGGATVYFAVDQQFANVSLSGNGSISVGQPPQQSPGTGVVAGTPTPTPSPAPDSQPLVLVAQAAAFVRDGRYANTAFTSVPSLVVKRGPAGFTRETFLTFDLSDVGWVHSAKLRLFGRLNQAAAKGVQVRVYAASRTPPPGRLTWNNRPSTGVSAQASATLSGVGGRWYEWDLTSLIRAQKAAWQDVVTLALKSTAATDVAALFNSGPANARGPRLVIA